MADVSDVRNALVTLLGNALYPGAVSGASAAGCPVRVYGGWPKATALDLDMAGNVLVNGVPAANGIGPVVNVSVFARPSVERNTTRYERRWDDQQAVTPTVTATASGATVALGGAVTATNYVSLIIGNQSVAYALQTGDTLPSAASALAALANAKWPTVTSSGAVITFSSSVAGLIVARTGAASPTIKEIKRQQRSFQITVWAPNETLRTAVGAFIDPVLANADFLALPDTTQAWMLYQGSNDSDVNESQTVYRRDLFYWAEYATTISSSGYQTTVPVVEIEPDSFIAPDYASPANWPSFNPVLTTIG